MLRGAILSGDPGLVRTKKKKTDEIRRKRLPRGKQDVVYYDNIIPTRFRTALVKKFRCEQLRL